jgi:hypothetical protein
MSADTIKLPYNIGDEVFIVENYNLYWDVEDFTPIHTIYGKDIVIKPMNIEGFIIDEKGIHIAEDGHDGWNKLTLYHDLTLKDDGVCRVFGTLKDAEEFVNQYAILKL